jgi:hypothetical protein
MAGILRILKEAEPEPDAELIEEEPSVFKRLDKDGSDDLTLAELQPFFVGAFRSNDRDDSNTLDEVEFSKMAGGE